MIINNISRIFSEIKTIQKFKLYLLITLMVLTSLSEALTLGALVPFLSALVDPGIFFENKFINNILIFFNITDSKNILLPLSLVFIFAALTSGILRMYLLWFLIRFSHEVGLDISYKIYSNSLRQKYIYHVSQNTSNLISGIIEKSNGVVLQFLLPSLSLISSSMLAIAIVTTLLIINPIITITAFCSFGSIYLSVVIATKRKLFSNSLIINKLLSKRIKSLQEGFGGIRDIILDNAYNNVSENYKKLDRPLRLSQASNQFIAGAPRYGIEAIGMALIVTIAYILTSNGNKIDDLMPLLGALAVGAQRLLPLMQQAYTSWSNIKGSEAILNQTIDFLERPINPETSVNKIISLRFRKNILIDNVSFYYPNNKNNILNDLIFEIKKGDKVGFIGETGSGKSTLLDLIMGLLEPTQGSLKIDGQIINDINRNSWRSNISHVPQNIFLLDSSINENIAFGVSIENIDYEKIKKVVKISQLESFINSLQDKYQTKIGERGVKISGGQRQRIGIARALYKDSNVIVFDEATSSLDTQTERRIMKDINDFGRNKTLLIVAHRLTTLSECDYIFEILDGKINRKITYSDLIKNS
ncbi:MAG: hypothetical protein CBD35_06485 [Verrucomicrobia bacterium TMED175]|nr:MAG: hypothetical protein CBD35_06485 [Verrucomicrobia bacterium TMED175]